MSPKLLFYVSYLIGILAFVAGIVMQIQAFSFPGGDVVWQPRFTRAECVGVEQMTFENFDWSGKTKWVTMDPQGQWFNCPFGNFYAPEGCDFVSSRDGWFGLVDNQECCKLSDKTVCDKNRCEISSYFSTDRQKQVQRFHVDPGWALYVNENTWGDVLMSGTSERYSLKIVGDNNYQDYTADCSIASISSKYDFVDFVYGAESKVKTLEGKTETDSFTGTIVLKRGVVINMVTALEPAISTRVISRPDIEGGQLIYVVSAGRYNQIKTSDNGVKYVDTSKTYDELDIECIPGFAGCDDTAHFVSATDLAQGSCNELLGNYVGYVPTGNDEACIYECKTLKGKPEPTSDCIRFDKCTDPAKPVLDYRTGECVAAGDVTLFDEEEIGLTGAFIAIGGLLWLLLTGVVDYIRREDG